MPLREHICQAFDCPQFGVIVEEFFHIRDAPPPDCAACHRPMKRLVSRFGVIWTGMVGGTKYNDPKREGYHQDGHWMMTRKTPDGKPKRVFIDTWQKMRQFCKTEGLADPRSVGVGEVSRDGKQFQFRGVSGQEV